MSDKPKVANIRLKPGSEPITVSGKTRVGFNRPPMRFPTLQRQKTGWNSQEAKAILKNYGDRYEALPLVEGGN